MQTTPSHSTLYAQNDNFKAIINPLSRDKYEITVFQWSEEHFDDKGQNMWERYSGPFVTETKDEAYKLAEHNLQLATGEILDDTFDESETEMIRQALGHDNWQSFSPVQYEVNHYQDETSQEIKAEKIICLEQFYLVLSQQTWYAGILSDDRTIHTFTTADSLEKILVEISKSAE